MSISVNTPRTPATSNVARANISLEDRLRKADLDLGTMMAAATPVYQGLPYVSVDLDAWSRKHFGAPLDQISNPATAKGVADILEDAAPGLVLGLRTHVFDTVEQLRAVR